MYQVMIIDDEKIVRKGIISLINWESLGFTICGEGTDGKDGLGKILRIQPDLVLVDIKMPGMNGIELIHKAQEQNFRGHFIILTGFSEFEFAKSAISLGVKGYLLKPIDEEELIDVLNQSREEFDQRERENVYRGENEEAAREEVLRKTVLQLESRDEIEKKLRVYHVDLSSKILCAAVVTCETMIPGTDNTHFKEKVNDFLKNPILYDEKIRLEDSVVLIKKGIDYKRWTKLLDHQNKRMIQKDGEGLLIAVGNNVSQWYDLPYSYEFARFLLKHEFLFYKASILSVDVIENQDEMAEKPTIEYLCLQLEVGDLEGIQRGMRQYRQYCMERMISEMEIKVQILYSLIQINERIEKHYEIDDICNIQELTKQLYVQDKLDDVLRTYYQILNDLCIKIGYDGSATVIRRIYYHMEKNYDQELHLETFAKMFHYNSNYLGKVFRKEIGDSFNNILDSIRITNAKRMLLETDLKVYQIAEQTGYKNLDYFYLKFKKYVGISPKEYIRHAQDDKQM